jgi:hypothetical protein
MEFLMGPKAKNFMLAGDGPENAKSRAMMEKTMYQGAPNASRGVFSQVCVMRTPH